MIKMITASFYNNLIDEDGAISKSSMLEIERIRNKGIIFSVCTNRKYQEVLDYNKDFPFVDYIISLNGSYIYDVKKQRCISKNKISISNLRKINDVFQSRKLLYYTEDNCYDDYLKIGEKEIYKIEIEVEDNFEITDKMKKINVNYTILEVDKKFVLEITSLKCTFFTGVDKVALKNGFHLNEIISVCSNESDYSLLLNILHSYLIKNSSKRLRTYFKGKKRLKEKESFEKIMLKI